MIAEWLVNSTDIHPPGGGADPYPQNQKDNMSRRNRLLGSLVYASH
jgi:hypothetical protein